MQHKGFTLAELLISLALLGVIATFTIPKVLQAQQNDQFNASAKEAASMLTNAYQQARLDGLISGSTVPGALTPYMNYVSVDTSGALIDDVPTYSVFGCGGTYECLRLHSGGVLLYNTGDTFSGGGYQDYLFDPDGKYSGTTTGTGKSVKLVLYSNGRLSTVGIMFSNPAYDPAWLKW